MAFCTVVALVAGAGSAAAGVGSPAAPALGDETLRLLRVTPSDTGANVDIAVPWSQSGRTLSLEAFQVSLSDEPVVVAADRLVDRPLLIDLVIDPPADPAAVAALQGALAEFIDQLDPGARVRLATPSRIEDLGQDRSAALDALRDLGSPDADGFRSRLASVLGDELPSGTAPSGVARVAIVSSAVAPIEALAADPAGVSLVRDDDYSPAVWGRFQSIIAAAPTLDAFDTAARDLRSTYRIAVPGATAGQRISVQVATDAGPARISGTVPGATAPPPSAAVPSATAPATVPGTSPATAAPDRSAVERSAAAPEDNPATVADDDDDDGGSWLPILLAVAGMVVGVALAAFAAVSLSRRQRAKAATTDNTDTTEPAPPAAAPTPIPTPTAPAVETPTVVPPAAEPRPESATPVAEPEPEPLVVTAREAGTPPPFDPGAMVSVAEVPTRPDEPAPLFSHEPEPSLAESPLFDSAEAMAPPVAPVFSASINLQTDVRIARATAGAERAIAALRALHDDLSDPTPRAVAIAIEAAASGWLENRRIGSDEVVRLLDPERAGADTISINYAEGLVDLLEGPDRNLWDLALAFAERLGHPAVPRPEGHYGPPEVSGSLVEQVAAVVALGESDFVGRLGGIVGRGLLASWPARAGRLDAMPLIVSPSLAAAADGLGAPTVDPADLIVGLLAVMEDAALRMMRSEQGVAALRERYLEQIERPLTGWAKFADKSAPVPPGWMAATNTPSDDFDVRLVGLIIGTPVVIADDISSRLAVDPQRASSAIAGLVERGWLTPLEPSTGHERRPERWVASEVLQQATKPFSPDYSPLDPVSIDLTVSRPRSVHHARS